MSQMKGVWRYLLVEPFTWLFYFLFQPAKFKGEVEARSFWGRTLQMLRLQLPMFLCYYPLALIARAIMYTIFPTAYTPCSSDGLDLANPCFLFIAAKGAWAGPAAIPVGLLFGTTFGVSISLANGLVGGVISNATSVVKYGPKVGVVYALIVGMAYGLLLGLTAISRRSQRRKLLVKSLVSIIVGFLMGVVGGLVFGFIGAYIVGRIGGSAITEGGTSPGVGVYVGGTVGCLTVAFIGTVMKNLARRATAVWEAIEDGQIIGTAFGIILGASSGAIGILIATGGIVTTNVELQITLSTEFGILVPLVIIFLIVGYLLGYYRLPLYPVSGLFMLKSYLNSRKNTHKVFYYLHHSSLYWDECIILPLPYLMHTLLLAAQENMKQTLKEIDFIMYERPQQRDVAGAVLQEICLRDLEGRESLRTVAGASQQLLEMLPQEMRLINTQWAMPFLRLEDASQDATRYYSPLDWQAKSNALENLLVNLDKVHPHVAFSDNRLNKRLSEVVHIWQVVTKLELENLRKASKGLGRISNPYLPGSQLQLNDSLFVGRGDLVQQLGNAMQRSIRPTFFLNGERRMGKSSILKQLPAFLSSRHLPIFYDLQSFGMISSASAFLAAIAEEIYEEMMVKGMQIKKLEYEQLQEAGRENEAMIYHRFERWLKHVEHLLEQEDRILLLAFDEFEQLEEAGRKNYLDLNLLLTWLRSIIQNRPRLALLFSGVKGIGDLGPRWAGYFVNVEMLRVSFLRPEEARQLITHPAPDVSQEQVFSEAVVQEIIRVTGCHPFLIQALCSKLIISLNYKHCSQADIPDVEIALQQVLETWDTYFRDLWERTDHHQRTCLTTIHRLGRGDIHEIKQQSSLDEALLRNTLQILIRRDLLQYDDGFYLLATPIFSRWLERN